MVKRICSLLTLIVLALTQCFTPINYVLAENNAEQDFQIEENIEETREAEEDEEIEEETVEDATEENIEEATEIGESEEIIEETTEAEENEVAEDVEPENAEVNEELNEIEDENADEDISEEKIVEDTTEEENTLEGLDDEPSKADSEGNEEEESSNDTSMDSQLDETEQTSEQVDSGNGATQYDVNEENTEKSEGIIDEISEEINEIITKIRYFFKTEGDSQYIKYGKDSNNIGTITLKDPKSGASITIMDKNLGAESVGTDKNSYGYYFQWGNNHGLKAVNSSNKTTQKAVYNDSYYNHGYDGQGLFIAGSADYWENGEHYNSLWGNESKESSRYGVCPVGYHIPTVKEWNQLLSIWGKIHTQDSSAGDIVLRYSADYATKNIHKFKTAATQCTQGETDCVDEDKLSTIIEVLSSELRLPLAGSYDENGNFHDGLGVYWTSISKNGNSAGVFDVDAYIGDKSDDRLLYKAQGHTIRCFQNIEPYEAPVILETQNEDDTPSGTETNNSEESSNSEQNPEDNLPLCEERGTACGGEVEDNTNPENDIPSDIESDSVAVDTTGNLVNEGIDVKEYTITWRNEDGTVRDTTTVAYGQMPMYEDPVQPSDAHYSYQFAGWEPELKVVDGDAEYKAKYTYIPIEYTITWKNEDGTVIDTTKVAYGQMPSHANPFQPADEKYSYQFAGWEPNLSEVKGDTEYRAKYKYVVNKCTITWKNEDGTIIDATEVAYGETPIHEDPIQPADSHYSYEFSGWIPQISEATGSAEYRATYKYIVNKYTVTWENEDGTVLETDEVEYGIIPTYDGKLPEKQSDGTYAYIFEGWDSEISEVTGDAVYMAKYNAEEIQKESESETDSPIDTQNEEIVLTGTETTENGEIGTGNTIIGEEDVVIGGGNGGIDESDEVIEIEDSLDNNTKGEEDQGFFEGLRETLKSFFLDDEDGYLRGSETIDDIVVSIEAEEGTFPEGTEVVIKGVAQERLESIQTSLIEDESNNVGENAQILAFDISFVYSGEEIQPSKEVSVKFNYEENSDFQGVSTSQLSVYHIDDETDEGEEIEVVNKDGDEIEILATDFSIYVLTLSDNNSITLTLDPGDGTISSGRNIVVDEYGIGTITSVSGDVTLPNVTRANHVFVGWYTGQTTSLQNFAGNGGDQYHVNSNITLYAKWCNRGSTINTDKTTCISAGNLKTILDQNPNFTYGEIEILRPAGLTDADGPASIVVMDRNLGASSAGTSNSARGYYYQYGNNYGFTQNPPTIARNIADVDLTAYGPGNPYYSGNFVLGKVGNTKYNNWPTTPNYNIWGFESDAEEDRQGPCPIGWHIPTIEERNKVIYYWTGNNGTMNVNNFRTELGLPLPGGIMRSDAKMEGAGSTGWFRTVSLDLSKEFVYELEVTSTSYKGNYSENMVNARQIRCFKNEEKRYTVTYTDGEDEEVFEDQIFSGLLLGDVFPQFSGNVSSRTGEDDIVREFARWYLSGSNTPFDVLSAIVTHDTILYAKWNEIREYTVTYTDGEDDVEIFEDQVFSGLSLGDDFPQFSGTISSRTGEDNSVHRFMGWYLSGSDVPFNVSGVVEGDVILKARWISCTTGEAENAHGECVPNAETQRNLQIVQDLDVYFLASDADKKHYTLMDRNMGATGVYNKNYNTPNPASLGYVYQWGNNYGFPARGDLAQQGVFTTGSQVPKSVWSLGVPSRYSSMTYYLNSSKDATWMAGGSTSDGIWGGTGDTASTEGANTTLEGRQGPCPVGYHVPSSVEIVTIFMSWSGVTTFTSWNGTTATSAAIKFSEDFLLPPAGRRAQNGTAGTEKAMTYRSSSPHPTDKIRTLGFYWNPTDDGLKLGNDDGRARGRPVRCVKNTVNTSTTAIETGDIHLNGGENAIISIDNGVISSLRSPTRTGSTFEGWYTSPDFSGNALAVGNTITAGSSLYAKFTCNESGYVWNGSECEGGVRLIFDSMGGTEVSSQLIESGMTGTRPADPTKTGYVFSGWFLTGAIEEFNFTGTIITGETTLYAHWNTGKYEVSIVSNNVEYGTVDSGSVTADYLTPISTNGNELTIGSTTVIATPTLSSTEYTYTFSGWNNTCGDTLTGNCTITAIFDRTVNVYTATIVASPEGYGMVDSGSVPADYGTSITTSDDTLTIGSTTITATSSASGEQYTYTFSGWDNTCGDTLTGNCTITAFFERTTNEYLITFQNEDLTVLQTGMVAYGDMPVYSGSTPQKTGSITYAYVFTGWNPTIHSVTGDQTYTAVFDRTTRKYDVTWKNIDGTILEIDEDVGQGTIPEYNGATPTGGVSNQYVTSTFAGWNPALSQVVKDVEYMARYTYTLTSGYVLDTTKNAISVTLNANGGEFSNNSGYDVLNYDYYNRAEKKYAHSSNYSDDGIRNTAAVASDDDEYLTTITGAEYLYLNLTYDLHEILLGLVSDNKDKLYVHAGKTASDELIATLSGNTNDGIQGNENFIITGDSVLLDFYLVPRRLTDVESNGFYAVIVGVIPVGYRTTGEIETPTREGYTFDGWYTQAQGGESVDLTGGAISGNMEVYAHWTANTVQYTVYHYVKIAGQSGYALSKTETLYGTSDEVLTLSSLAKESEFMCAHYSSGSLSGTGSGPGPIVTQTTINPDGSTKIYLYYVRNYHTVHLTGDEHVERFIIGGVETDEAVRECGSEVPVEAIPKPGYHIVRWDREERTKEE